MGLRVSGLFIDRRIALVQATEVIRHFNRITLKVTVQKVA